MLSALTEESVMERKAADPRITVRKAAMHDIQPILDLINSYAAKGIMLPRTEFEMSENIRDFSVAYEAERLVGCAALHFYSPVIAEVRSLAVAPECRSRGIGWLLVEALVREAREYRLDAVFAFTYVPEFFGKLGFQKVERGELPLKAWKDCLRCPKFHSCDEIAVVKMLEPGRRLPGIPRFDVPEDLLVQLPTIKAQ